LYKCDVTALKMTLLSASVPHTTAFYMYYIKQIDQCKPYFYEEMTSMNILE